MTVDLNMMLDLRDLQVAMDVAKRAEMGWFDVEFTMYGTCFERCGKRYFRVSADAARIYDFIETKGSQIFSEATGLDIILPANVDLYSGFVYNALNIPLDLATPIFACARISGWCAHRIEELACSGRIMRPAYQCVKTPQLYVSLKDR